MIENFISDVAFTFKKTLQTRHHRIAFCFQTTYPMVCQAIKSVAQAIAELYEA